MLAVEHAYRILGWQENLQPDELPPSWCWHLEGELELWFEEVDRKRREKYGLEDDSSGPSDSMMSNDFAQGRR